jgi:hypothetical protein
MNAKNLLKKLMISTVIGTMALVSNAAIVPVSGDITANTTWTKNNQYFMTGFVYVKSGATLTIEPGTVIKGDKLSKATLIVTRTGKINAAGTAAEPIVFTSNQVAGSRAPGDWGGIIILGNAPENFKDTTSLSPLTIVQKDGVIEGGVDNAAGDGKFGGTNAADNSGTLTYVRIEFPGVAFQPNNEINGLTLGGVGSGTTLSHIQVSYSGDDSYEWFGGTVNADHLIAYSGTDDDFDTDNGFGGKVQFGVAFRNKNISDLVAGGASNGFESDNDAGGSSNTPVTAAVFSNITIIGPRENASTDLTGQNFKRGAHIRRNSRESVFNSLFVGFPTGLYIDGAASQLNVTNGDLNFKYNTFAGCPKMEKAYDTAFVADVANNISLLAATTDAQLTDPYNATAPNAVPTSGSPVLSGADFTNAKLGTGFTTVTYRGAFGANDTWATGWTNLDPQNTVYNAPTSIEEIASLNSIQVMPNPFAGVATVSLELSENATVAINLFDISGRLVKNIANTNASVGHNQYTVNAADLSNGVYFVKTQIGSETKTVKLILNK